MVGFLVVGFGFVVSVFVICYFVVLGGRDVDSLRWLSSWVFVLLSVMMCMLV